MTYLLRVACAVLLLMIGASAMAATQYRVKGPNSGKTLGPVYTPEAACRLALIDINEGAGPGYTYSINKVTQTGCILRRQDGALWEVTFDISEGACGGGREADASGQCVCKKGTVEPPGGAGACVPAGQQPGEPPKSDDQKCADAALLHNSIGTDRIGRIKGKHPLGKEVQVCRDSGFKGNSGQPLGCTHSFTGEAGLGYADGWLTEGESWANTDSSAGSGVGLACALGLDKDPDKPEDANKVPTESKPPANCRNGYAGSVNGVDVCIDRASGEQTGVNFTRVTDGNGSQSDLRTTVSCVRDVCSVTEIKTPIGRSGSPTTTTTNNVDRAQFCRDNRSNPVCGAPTGSSTKPGGTTGGGAGGGTGGNSGGGGAGNGDGDGEDEGDKSEFGGSCSAGFTCRPDAKGDAIQCAMAKEQHKRNCDLLQTDTPDTDYAAAADGTDDKSADALKGKAEQISVSQLDSSGMGWSRACPADLTFDVVGRTFAIPFSKVCPILNVMALAAVALTLLSCLLWVVGKKE